MKFLAKVAILSAIGLTPFFAAASPQSVTFPSNYSGEVKGAVYFMSNDPSGNYLFAADIGADARVTLRYAYYTGGKGASAAGPTGNALFSQGSVVSTLRRTWHLNVVVLAN
ncbi:hypothetical protein AX15_006745, partial [Amanita polypyramis BW_CC]